MREGQNMHSWAQDLWPIPRSLTGDGVRQTLAYIQKLLPALQPHEIPTGTKVFDWEVPDEWAIQDAYIITPNGQKICDFKQNNLHVVGYSEPVRTKLSLQDLKEHLYTQPDQPDWIPYVTSYYHRRWGFCLSHNQMQALPDGEYEVLIDSRLEPGSLTYGDVVIKGKSSHEVLLSTYICHPSMANNELSGPMLVTALGQWLASQKDLHYTYRLVYVPETIGSIAYLSKHLDHLQQKMVAGYQVTCVGDERTFSYIPSRYGNTLADRIATETLAAKTDHYDTYTFLDRGSDERQYCAPGVDLPLASICRSKYGIYPEYHTSADDLTLVTPAGLQGAFDVYKAVIEELEASPLYQIETKGEPQLGKRGLYPTISQKGSASDVTVMMNFLAYADGTNRLKDIARITGAEEAVLQEIADKMAAANLIRRL